MEEGEQKEGMARDKGNGRGDMEGGEQKNRIEAEKKDGRGERQKKRKEAETMEGGE